MRPLSLVSCAALLGASSFVSAQGQVLVVDDAFAPGAGTFFGFQSAINAANDGDLVLGLPGTYSATVVIDGKSLFLVGEPGCRISKNSTDALVVRNLAPGQHVTVLGLEVETLPLLPTTVSSGDGLHAESSLGSIWIQDSEIKGYDGIDAVGCEALICVSSTILGHGPEEKDPVGFPFPTMEFPWGAALRATGATRVAAYGSTFEGGRGFNSECYLAGNCATSEVGGSGAFFAERSAGFFSDCQLLGGDGEDADFSCINEDSAGSGGLALAALGPQTRLELLSVVLEGGAGAAAGFCGGGAAGELLAGSGDVDEILHAPRSVTCDSPVRVGETSTFVFEGEPFDFVFALVSDTPTLDLPAASIGPNALGPSLFVRTVGLLPSTGRLEVPVQAGALPAGAEFSALFLQGLHVTPAMEVLRGAPTVFVVLDPAF